MAKAEYFYFSVDCRLNIFLWIFLGYCVYITFLVSNTSGALMFKLLKFGASHQASKPNFKQNAISFVYATNVVFVAFTEISFAV